MLKFDTYSENLRDALDGNNMLGRPVAIRELSLITGYSYEHCRKLVKNHKMNDKLSVSRACNDIICEFLGLSKDEMWGLAVSDKLTADAQHQLGTLPFMADETGKRIARAWQRLSQIQREYLASLAERLHQDRALTGVAVRR